MKELNSVDHGTFQNVSVPSNTGSGLGSALVALLSCALSLAALVVSIANLYTLLKLIRIITPIMTLAQ